MATTQWAHEGYTIAVTEDGRFCFTQGGEDAAQNYYETLAKAREAIDRIKANEQATQRERLSIPAYASTDDKTADCEITGVHAGTLDLLTKPKFAQWDHVTLYFRCAAVKALLDKERELETALEAVRKSLTPFKLFGYNYSERRTHEAVIARIKADVARMEAYCATQERAQRFFDHLLRRGED